MDNDVELSRLYWQNFVYWREEKFGLCQWIVTLSGTDIMQDDKFIAYKTNIPEKYYVVKRYIIGTPWEQYAKEIVTTVTQ